MAIMNTEENKPAQDGKATESNQSATAPVQCPEGQVPDGNGGCKKKDDGNDTHPPKPPVP